MQNQTRSALLFPHCLYDGSLCLRSMSPFHDVFRNVLFNFQLRRDGQRHDGVFLYMCSGINISNVFYDLGLVPLMHDPCVDHAGNILFHGSRIRILSDFR